MGVHLAPTLRVLRDEIDTRWPRRDRRSDGWLGDASHQARHSDHNPDPDDRSVNAVDVDVDGIDPLLVVPQAVANPATQYVIYNRTIWSRNRDFRAARYTRIEPARQTRSMSSVSHQRALEDSRWPLGVVAATASG